MGFPVSFLIIAHLFLTELSFYAPWQRFLVPVDELSALSLRGYHSAGEQAVRLVFYVKPGEEWQQAGEPDDVRWSGYRTLSGEAYRYGQARIYVKKMVEKEKGGVREVVWEAGGLIDNIPTCIPARSRPDYMPVLELVSWLGEEPHLRLRYTKPLESFSSEALADIDPLVRGNQGDFGSVFIGADGITRTQRGVDISGKPGVTPVMAAAVGRVVLTCREGDAKAAAVDARTGLVTTDFPPGRAGKGATLDQYGNCVYIAHPDGYTIRYAHLGDVEVEAGEGVLPGTRIGTVGVSEAGGGPPGLAYVHVEVRFGDPLNETDSVPVNPWEFFEGKMK